MPRFRVVPLLVEYGNCSVGQEQKPQTPEAFHES